MRAANPNILQIRSQTVPRHIFFGLGGARAPNLDRANRFGPAVFSRAILADWSQRRNLRVQRGCELKKKTVYIAIEIKAREFVSQVLLASKIVLGGGRVYLGSKSAVSILLSIKPENGGTLLFKGGSGEANGFRKTKESVATIAVLDQEMSPGLRVLNPASRFLGTDVDFVDRFYFVGTDFAEQFLKERPDVDPTKLRVLGWPRIDLWLSEYKPFWELQAARIQERFGPFVLFSSDFGHLHLDDVGWRIRNKKEYSRIKGFDFSEDTQWEKLTRIVEEFDNVVELLRSLDGNGDFPPIVVRPHPSERISRWIDATNGMDKTYVIFEGDITPWLHSSVALLHRGCTTALQAEIMGKPAGFIITNETLRLEMRNSSSNYSKEIKSVEDGLELVCPDYEVPPADLQVSRLASLDGSASDKISSDLLDLTGEEEDRIPPFWAPPVSSRFISLIFRKLFRRLFQRNEIRTFSIPKNVASNKMAGGISPSEVRTVLRNLGIDNLKVKRIGHNLVCIEAG